MYHKIHDSRFFWVRLYEVEIELDEVVFVELCHLFHRCHFF